MVIVPALFFTGTLTGPLEQLASAADRGGRAHQGSVYRGGSGGGGGRVYGSPSRAGRQRGDYVRSGGYSRSGDYGRRGSYYRSSGSRHSGYGHGGYYRHGGYYGHGGHGHGSYYSTSIWFGPSWGWSVWDPFYYPYYPYYYRYPYPYPYYGPSTTVVVPQEPQEYIMQAPGQQETGYWYYCREAKGYYPYVEKCPGGWLRVVPQEPPDADEE